MAPSSMQLALHILLLHYKVAIFELELRKRTSRSGLVAIFELELQK